LWLDHAKKLLIRDPGKIAIVGSKEATLGCGVQKRKVVIVYAPKPDAKFQTIGDVLQVEFQ
jgi:hypothetical protein